MAAKISDRYWQQKMDLVDELASGSMSLSSAGKILSVLFDKHSGQVEQNECSREGRFNIM